jgi:RHS repeat-associated protein
MTRGTDTLKYYAFGSAISEMQFKSDTGGAYRYGFNGMEKDNESFKDAYDFGARIYDGRIGKWFSLDEFNILFANESPYNFSINSPIGLIDKGGNFPIPKDARIINSNWHGGILLQKTDQTFLFVRLESPHGSSDWNEDLEVWYQYSYFANKWQIINAPVNCLYCDIVKIAKWSIKNLARYTTPIEELYILYSGKNFDGEIDSRGKAGIWLAIGIVPGGKILKPVKKILKSGVEIFAKSSNMTLKLVTISYKISDEISSIVSSISHLMKNNAKEIIMTTFSGTGEDALKVAKKLTNLGDDATPFYGDFGKWEGKLTGWQSKNKRQGWRLDWDSEKGAHINWWNHDTGEKGAILIDSNERNIENIINNEIIKHWND